MPPLLLNEALPQGAEVFEGPEKKLEVFFSPASCAQGFRSFQQPVWSELLACASCSILHRESNAHFDAYLLSESSLFVYPNRVILKTCGTTGLLLVLPKLLDLASRLGVLADHVHYGHYRYKFPEQQLYPHSSFEQEADYMRSIFGHVEAKVLGPADGRCWYALCTKQASAPPRALDLAGDDLFEMAMEGLPLSVCEQFIEASHPSLHGRALAEHMTFVSGIRGLLPDVHIDDWAFEPCGYSMNGLRGAYYYTIHITPEENFSYASFETNDPAYRTLKSVAAVAAVFCPAFLTISLTARGGCDLPSFDLSDYERCSREVTHFSDGVGMCAITYNADVRSMRKRKLAPIASPAPSNSTELTACDSDGGGSDVSFSNNGDEGHASF